jgi:hypothetical protein
MLTMRSLPVFLLFLLLATAGAGTSAELTGVITQVQGTVEVVGPGVRGLPRANLWQVLQAGATIRVSAGGAVGVVCSNRRFVRLRGRMSWSLTEPSCMAGKELTPAEYALIAPQGGRFKVVEGLLVLDRDLRSGDGADPLAPIVLRPRNTVLRSPRPTVSWIRVPSATEYEIHWTGRDTNDDGLRLRAGEVACAEEQEGMSLCSWPWPEERPDLPPGEVFFLRIATRSGIGEPWHMNDPVEVRTQEIKDSLALERELRDLERLGFENAALETARAGLLAGRGLYADASERYRRALAAEPAAELEITLADLDVVTGLHDSAEPRYRRVLAEGSPTLRAAAAFGLGRIAYARQAYREAAASFRQAGELYSLLGLAEEGAAARQAADRAAMRAPR